MFHCSQIQLPNPCEGSVSKISMGNVADKPSDAETAMRQQRSYTNHHVCFGTVLKGMRVVREIGELGTKVGKTQHRDAPFIFLWDLKRSARYFIKFPMMRIRCTMHSENSFPPIVFCSMSWNKFFLRSKGAVFSWCFCKTKELVAPTGCAYNIL